MSDKDLDAMGIKTVGDRVELRAFCKREKNKEDKRPDLKRKLSEILQASRSRRLSLATAKTTVKPKAKPSTATKKPTLRFEIRWKHFVKGFGYKLKKSDQGGGVRTVDFPRYATANECLAEMKLFFQNGQTCVGSVEDMEFRMADFKCEEIYFSDEFPPESYKKRYSLHTPRLFLLSKDTSESSDDSNYDAEYAKPNVAKFNSSILIQFNIYLFNSVHICSIQSLHSFNLIRIDSI